MDNEDNGGPETWLDEPISGYVDSIYFDGGAITGTVADTVEYLTHNMSADRYVDTQLRFDIHNVSDRDLRNDVILPVLSNDGKSFLLDLTELGTNDLGDIEPSILGQRYEVAHRFDNLEIRGGGRLRSTGSILVISGDLHSGDATTLEFSSSSDTLSAQGYVDVNSATLHGPGSITTILGTATNSNWLTQSYVFWR